MGNCCSVESPPPAEASSGSTFDLPPDQQLPVKNYNHYEEHKMDVELQMHTRVAKMKCPIEVIPMVAKYCDLDTFLALRLTSLPIYRTLTAELWQYVHFDIRQADLDKGGVISTSNDWPTTKRVGMPNELWQPNRFLFENKHIQRYIRLDENRMEEFIRTILKGRLSRALRNVQYLSLFLVPQTAISLDEAYIRLLSEMTTSNVIESFRKRPIIFVDVLLARLIPYYMPNIERFDIVLKGYDAYSDRTMSAMLAKFPHASRHLFLNDLTGLYYTDLNSANLKTLVLTVSSTIWGSVQRTFKSECPVLPSSVEYLEINRKWMRPESKLAEVALTDERMTKFLSKATNLHALKIHTYHELEDYSWIPDTVTDLSIDDGDESPQYITRTRISLPNVTRFSVTTPYGGIFRKLDFTSLHHLQVGDLDNCECLAPVLSSNPNLHTLLMGDSEGTGPIWNVVLRNSSSISTLVIEGEPDVFDPYSNGKEVKLTNLRTLGLTVLAEAEQVTPVLVEVLRRTPALEEFFLRCEQLDEEAWSGYMKRIEISEVIEQPNFGNSMSDEDDEDDDDSIGSGEVLQTYVVNVEQCRKHLL